jgi:hypothetical protein
MNWRNATSKNLIGPYLSREPQRFFNGATVSCAPPAEAPPRPKISYSKWAMNENGNRYDRLARTDAQIQGRQPRWLQGALGEAEIASKCRRGLRPARYVTSVLIPTIPRNSPLCEPWLAALGARRAGLRAVEIPEALAQHASAKKASTPPDWDWGIQARSHLLNSFGISLLPG